MFSSSSTALSYTFYTSTIPSVDKRRVSPCLLRVELSVNGSDTLNIKITSFSNILQIQRAKIVKYHKKIKMD